MAYIFRNADFLQLFYVNTEYLWKVVRWLNIDLQF